MDQYMEYLVKRQAGSKETVTVAAGIVINAVLLLCGLFLVFQTNFGFVPLLLGVIMLPITKLVILPMKDVEFEYLYVDKQLSVDKIFEKSRRKNVGNFVLEKFEILCPEDSDRLSEFNNRTYEVLDFAGHCESEDYSTYVLIYDGKQKILLDLPEDFVKMIQNNAPRKVYLDKKIALKK